MLSLDKLSYRHPGQTRDYEFTLSLTPGRIAAVTGASGAGKSTLLDLVAGFLSPLGGTLEIDGRDLLPLAPEQRPVSLLFQADNLFDHLSADANLALALPRIPKPERQAHIDTALAEVGLSGFGPRRAASLSGGQKQRVALARTLLLDRPVLLLDEPFSALDAETAAEMRALVARLVHEKAWHALMVTHNPADLEIAQDHFALVDGQLIAQADATGSSN